jgi:hypothetical protein
MATLDTDDQRRQLAIKRLEKRSEFWTHLAAYLLVNAVILMVWYVAAGGGFFWPIFPLLGWGIGVFFHGMDVFRRPLTEDRIRRELDRMP